MTLISPSSRSCRELPERNPLSLKEAERVRALVERMEGAKRLFLHAMVVPNAPATEPLEFMEEAVARYPIKAWKSYTQWGPEGMGWELDDPAIGIPFIEKARALGVRNDLHPQRALLLRAFPSSTGAVRTSGARRSATPT